MTRIVVDPDALDSFAHSHEVIGFDMSKQFASEAAGMLNVGKHVVGLMSDASAYPRYMAQQAEIATASAQVIGGIGMSVLDLRGYALKVRAAEVVDNAAGMVITATGFYLNLRKPIHTVKIAKGAEVVSSDSTSIEVQANAKMGVVGGKLEIVTDRYSDGSVRVTLKGMEKVGRGISSEVGLGGVNASAGGMALQQLSWDVADEETARRLEWALAANLAGANFGLSGALIADSLLPVPMPTGMETSSGGYVEAGAKVDSMAEASVRATEQMGIGYGNDGPYAFVRLAHELSANVGVPGWPSFSGAAEGKIEIQVKKGLASEVTISFERLPQLASHNDQWHLGRGEKLSAQVKVDLTKVTSHGARAALDAWRADPVGGAPMLEKLVTEGGPGVSAELIVTKVDEVNITPLNEKRGRHESGDNPTLKLSLGHKHETVIRRVKFG